MSTTNANAIGRALTVYGELATLSDCYPREGESRKNYCARRYRHLTAWKLRTASDAARLTVLNDPTDPGEGYPDLFRKGAAKAQEAPGDFQVDVDPTWLDEAPQPGPKPLTRLGQLVFSIFLDRVNAGQPFPTPTELSKEPDIAKRNPLYQTLRGEHRNAVILFRILADRGLSGRVRPDIKIR